MTRAQHVALALFSVGMIGLGVLALIYGDFALVWQPVPTSLPGRTGLAYACGLLMLSAGTGLLFDRTRSLSASVLFPYLFIWLLLKVPALVVAPQMEAVWLGFGELAVLFSGGWVLLATMASPGAQARWPLLMGTGGVQAARILFGVSLLPIGLSHIVYVKQTAELVPAWLPFRSGWAYLTGVGQIVCGLGALFPRLASRAAALEGFLLSSFTVLVWAPAILQAPRTRLPWTAFFISWVIAASAWLMATYVGTGSDAGLELGNVGRTRSKGRRSASVV